LTPYELRILCDQWIERENRAARPTAILTVAVASAFGNKLELENLLPFPPPRQYMDEDESMAYLDRLFGVKNG